jgi:RimJ/RimL family protein N-acetyltransferase
VIFSATTPLVTDRLVLRPLRETDLDDVAAYQSLDEVVRYLPWPLRDREQSREHLALRMPLVRLEGDDDVAVLAIALDGRVIGDLTVILRSVENRTIELGWVLHPSRQRRGFAAEAVGAILSTIFDGMHFHRVIARIDPRNEASAALARKLGMRHEARLESAALIKGEWVGTDIWALLETEWRAAASKHEQP